MYELYDNDGNVFRPNIIEDCLAKIEGKMNNILLSIIDSSYSLDVKDYAMIILFVIIQIMRMPDSIKTFSKCCAEEVFQDKQINISDEQERNIYKIFTLPGYSQYFNKFINEFIKMIDRKNINIMYTSESTDVFCIGNNMPLLTYKTLDIDFPISSNVLIRISDNQPNNYHIEHDEVSYINKIMFEKSKLIYSSVPIEKVPGCLLVL